MTRRRLRHLLMRHKGQLGACWDCVPDSQKPIHRAIWDRILADPETVSALTRGEEDFKAGRYVRFKDIRP